MVAWRLGRGAREGITEEVTTKLAWSQQGTVVSELSAQSSAVAIQSSEWTEPRVSGRQ